MPLTVGDRLEITDLIARYNQAVDSGDAEARAGLFTDDAVFESSNRTLRGRAELLTPIDPVMRSHRHWVDNVIIEEDGDGARMTCYLVVLEVSDPPKVRLTGVYTDTLRKVDGAWKFATRKFTRDPDKAPQ